MSDNADNRFKIIYCHQTGYLKPAEHLASELESKGACELVPGANEEFEVIDRGVKIFSKQITGRLPEPGEINDIVKHREKGFTLQESQDKAAADHGHPLSVLDWIYSLFRGPSAH